MSRLNEQIYAGVVNGMIRGSSLNDNKLGVDVQELPLMHPSPEMFKPNDTSFWNAIYIRMHELQYVNMNPSSLPG